MHKTLTVRIVGYLSSLILTLTAFFIIFRPEFFHFGYDLALESILVLALLQFVFQSVCFLNIWGEKGPKWNLVIFISTICMIIIVVIGSIWIMNHLDYNMMPRF